MNPNEPSAGTEPGTATGNEPSDQQAETADQQWPSGPDERSSSTHGGNDHQNASGGEHGGVPAGPRPSYAEPGGARPRPSFEAHSEPRQPAEHTGPQATGRPEGAPRPAAAGPGTGPGLPPHGYPPRWATGPNDAEHAFYTFPPPGTRYGDPVGGQPGQPGQFAAHSGGPVPSHGGPSGPHGPSGPGGAHSGESPYGGGGGFGTGGHGGHGGQPPFGGPYPGSAPQPEKKRGSGRVVTVAAMTALITSLIVGPSAALGTAYLFPNGLGGPISSLSGEQSSAPTQGAVGDVAEQVLPSVVSIQTANGGGSGVVISSDGQILTNAHVVEAAQGSPLEVLFNDGTSARAEVLGSDPVSDIAVIHAEGRNGLEPATLGDSDQVGVGAEVVAIGSPLGLSGTVTRGVISALNRPVNTGATESGSGQTSTVINAIQTDAAINPGNSGGPLVNMSGEVIGINTAIAGISQESGSVGLGFAIPINQVRPTAEQLVENGSASYPAIEATITNATNGGAEIVDVTGGGAADEAGLRAGDVVVSVDGEPVSTPDQLIAEIRVRRPGDEVTFGVQPGGGGSEEEVTVTLGEQSATSTQDEAEETEGD